MQYSFAMFVRCCTDVLLGRKRTETAKEMLVQLLGACYNGCIEISNETQLALRLIGHSVFDYSTDRRDASKKETVEIEY